MAFNWTPDRPYYEQDSYTPTPLTSPRSGPVKPGTITTRINQLQEIFHSNPAASTVIHRRENSRTGFGRRQGNVFAGPALRNSRLDQQPEMDGTHTYLGANIARTNHKQEHATAHKVTNWEKTTGLHAQMQPTGIAYRATGAFDPRALPLKNECKPTRRRRYDRNGNLIVSSVGNTNAEPDIPRSQPPPEQEHVLQFPSLSTVLESQLIDQEEEHPLPVEDTYGGSMQNTQTSHREPSSSCTKSMPNETPLSTKKRNVREMYDYYGIKRPTELSSDCTTHDAEQMIRVQRNCHMCGWINGPDTKCWKCRHRFCEECDDISPKVFFQSEDNFPPEDFQTPANPIKLSLADLEHQAKDPVRKKSIHKREESFPLQFPYVNMPEPASISAPEDTTVGQYPVIETSLGRDGPRPETRKQTELRKTTKPATHSLRSEFGANNVKLKQTQESQGLETVALARTRGPKSSAHHPLPICMQDVPRRSPAEDKAQGVLPAVDKSGQSEKDPLSAMRPKQTRIDPQQPPQLLKSTQNIPVFRVERPDLQMGGQEVPTAEPLPDSMFKAPTDSVEKKQPFPKKGALTDSKLRPTPVSRGSHRHRRTRRHASGSQSNSSSSGEDFSCDSPGCRATHNGHQPYRHSISCNRKKYRCPKDTDSGYIASRSHHDDPGGTLPHTHIGPSSDLPCVERRDFTNSMNPQKNRHYHGKVPHARVEGKKCPEYVECYGYLNDCPCEICQSIRRMISEQEERPLLTANASSGETQVFMPQPQRRAPSPEKLDPLHLSSLEPQPVQDTPECWSALDQSRFASTTYFQEGTLKGADTEPSATRRVTHEKVKGDTLGKPISFGYEPLSRVPLHTISHIQEEVSTLPPSEATKPEPEPSPPDISDLPTPATEKIGQKSFFADANQQRAEGGLQQDEIPAFPAKIPLQSDSNRNMSLGRVSEGEVADERSQGHFYREASRRESENRIVSRPGEIQVGNSILRNKTPEIIRKLNVQQPYQVARKDVQEPMESGKSAETRAHKKSLGGAQSQARKSPQQSYCSASCSIETSSTPGKSPTPASRSLSVILERDTLPFLSRKLQQQQYELDRITKLLNDHFAEISQPSAVLKAVPIIEKRVSEQETEEKAAKTEDAKKRTGLWPLNLFERKPSLRYGEPSPPLQEDMLREREADMPAVVQKESVTDEAQIQVIETGEPPNDGNGVERVSPSPEILVREPTAIPIEAAVTAVLERQNSMIADSNVKRLARAFSPLNFAFGSPKSSPKEKEIQQQGPEVEDRVPEYKEDRSKLTTGKVGCSCNCGILGVTVLIHFEGREDVVVRAELKPSDVGETGETAR